MDAAVAPEGGGAGSGATRWRQARPRVRAWSRRQSWESSSTCGDAMAAASSLALLLAGIAVAGSGCLTVEAELPEVEDITQLLTGRPPSWTAASPSLARQEGIMQNELGYFERPMGWCCWSSCSSPCS